MKKMNIIPTFYMFRSSSHSKEPSNSLNPSKSKSFLIISTKLKGGLKPIFKSFHYFFSQKSISRNYLMIKNIFLDLLIINDISLGL